MSLPPGPEGLEEGTYGIHVHNKGWIPDSRLFPNKQPNKPFHVPRYLIPQHRYLTQMVPEDISKLIINFAYSIGPRARLNATVLHDYNVAERFYMAIIYSGLRVNNTLMWLPMPYYHPLRAEAIKLFIDFSAVPWVENQH